MVEFQQSLAESEPPATAQPLAQALWFEAKGNWDRAHTLALSVHTARGAWIHAYLHLKEGDMANAAYWYARAGRDMPMATIEEEWEKICRVILQAR